MSSKDTDKKCVIHSKKGHIKIMIGKEIDEVSR